MQLDTFEFWIYLIKISDIGDWNAAFQITVKCIDNYIVLIIIYN